MTYVLPVTQARRDFLSLIDKVDVEYTRIDLTKNGRIKASLVSPEYLDSLEETIYTLQHSMKAIREAQREIAKGNYVTLDQYLAKFHAGKAVSHSKKGRKKSH